MNFRHWRDKNNRNHEFCNFWHFETSVSLVYQQWISKNFRGSFLASPSQRFTLSECFLVLNAYIQIQSASGSDEDAPLRGTACSERLRSRRIRLHRHSLRPFLARLHLPWWSRPYGSLRRPHAAARPLQVTIVQRLRIHSGIPTRNFIIFSRREKFQLNLSFSLSRNYCVACRWYELRSQYLVCCEWLFFRL